jgi:hypothetical protein
MRPLDYSSYQELGQGFLSFVLMAVVGWVICYFLSRNRPDSAPLQYKLFFGGYAIRAAVSIALYVFGYAEIIGDADSLGYMYGQTLDFTWTSTGVGLLDLPVAWVPAFTGNHLGNYYLIGTLYFITGLNTRLAAAAMNCCCGALTAVFAYRVARELFNESIARRVGLWTCIFPSMIIWSAQTIKEPVVILIETIALYGSLRLRMAGFAVHRVFFTAFAVFMLLAFRFYAAYIAGVAVLAALMVPDLKKGKVSIGAAIVIGAVLAGLVINMGLMTEQEARIDMFDTKFIMDFRYNVAQEGGSGVATDFDMRTTSGFSLATLVGAAHLLLAPFPWQLGGASLRMLLTLPELVFWWFLVFAGVFPGLKYVLRWRKADTLPLLLFVFGMGLLYSMMFGNVGLIFRQRAQILPWLFVLASVGLELRAIRKAEMNAHAIPRPAPA